MRTENTARCVSMKLRARAAYAKFIRRRHPRALALISRRNLNAYHVPSRRPLLFSFSSLLLLLPPSSLSLFSFRDYHNRAIIAREFKIGRVRQTCRRPGLPIVSQRESVHRLTINPRRALGESLPASYIQVSRMTKHR